MANNSEKFDQNLKAHEARIADLSSRAILAMHSAEERTGGIICARLILGAQVLLKSYREAQVVYGSVEKGKRPPEKIASPTRRPTLAEIKAIKAEIIFVWNATSYFGVASLRRALPEYFSVLTLCINSILDGAESSLLAHELPRPYGHLDNYGGLFVQSEFSLWLLQTYLKSSRGLRRSRLTLSMVLLDDVNKLTYANMPEPALTGEQNLEPRRENLSELEVALEVAYPLRKFNAVHHAVAAVLLPIAKLLFEKARAASPEVDNPERIARLD